MDQKIIIPTLFAALTFNVVHAAGFEVLEQNGSGLGNAYAGSAAVAENASTIFFNPAGMTQLKGTQISGGVVRTNPSSKFQDDGSSAGAFTGTGNGVDSGTTANIPNLYVSTELTAGLYGGIGMGSPFGAETQYQVPWAGAAQSILFKIDSVNINPSLAYKINERFSIGVGLNYQQFKMRYDRRASTLTAFSLSSDAISFQADDDDWGWNAGMLWQAWDNTRFSLSYRSKMKYSLKGDLQVSGPTAALLALNGGGASAAITAPDSATLSVVQKLGEQWEILGDISLTRWSRIQSINIILDRTGTVSQRLDANFSDTRRVALGANCKISDAWKLKTGIGSEEGATSSADFRLTMLPDNDRNWLAAGAQWMATKSLTVDGGLAYIKVRDAAINNDQRSSNRGLVSGTYTGNIMSIGVQLSYLF